MTLDQDARRARAFWEDPEATDDQVQAAFLIAQQKKFELFLLGDEQRRLHLIVGSLGIGQNARAARMRWSSVICFHKREGVNVDSVIAASLAQPENDKESVSIWMRVRERQRMRL